MGSLKIADLSGLLLDREWTNKEFTENFFQKKSKYDKMEDLQEWSDELLTFVPASPRQKREAAEIMAELFYSLRGIPTLNKFLNEDTVGHILEDDMYINEAIEIYTFHGGTELNARINGCTCQETTVEYPWLKLSTVKSFGRAWNANGTLFTDMEIVRGMAFIQNETIWNPDTQDLGDRGKSNVPTKKINDLFFGRSINDYL